MHERMPTFRDMDYAGEGEAGLRLSIQCFCGERITLAQTPWWADHDSCGRCGRLWKIVLQTHNAKKE